LGVLVHWRSPKKEFSGLVRYCVYREIGLLLGVEFDGVKIRATPQLVSDLQSKFQQHLGREYLARRRCSQK